MPPTLKKWEHAYWFWLVHLHVHPSIQKNFEVCVLKFHNGFIRPFFLSELSPFVELHVALEWKFTVRKHVHSLSWIVLIRILWNLVTLFSTIMSSSSLIMVHITPYAFWSYCPLLPIWKNGGSLSQIVLIRILWNLVTWFSTIMSSSSLIMVHMAPCF